MFVYRFSMLYHYVASWVTGGLSSNLYRLVLFSVFLCFLGLRLPYLFGLVWFGLFILSFVFPLFLSLFFSRVFDKGPYSFFSGLLPVGTPLWIAPFVCLVEGLSYIVRPFVLMLRPFVNLSMGAFGGHALGSLFFSSGVFLILLFVFFFYEIFVAVVHWFIVCNILSFSEEH
uniref:ATP synthase F0 subunit 6 n=1 Tax=Carassotrema koreanum TaxID=2573094 RepID=UPI002176E2D3|nr:ATP synthase F0 subunit 6 [Carassotrema koreanum]UUF92000.1 ATP synthase subunit 6 [Carassotrema koreanum]